MLVLTVQSTGTTDRIGELLRLVGFYAMTFPEKHIILADMCSIDIKLPTNVTYVACNGMEDVDSLITDDDNILIVYPYKERDEQTEQKQDIKYIVSASYKTAAEYARRQGWNLNNVRIINKWRSLVDIKEGTLLYFITYGMEDIVQLNDIMHQIEARKLTIEYIED